MADDVYQVDTEVLRGAAQELERRVRVTVGPRSSLEWADVSGCGSQVVCDAMTEFADWYLATWARIESGLSWLAAEAAAAAGDYEAAESSAVAGAAASTGSGGQG